MGRMLKWSGLAFSVGLGATVAYRMSAEAMAVVIGVVCGVLASVLMSTLMWIVARGAGSRDRADARVYGRPDYPPVVVIQGGAPPGRLGSAGSYGGPGAWDAGGFYLPDHVGRREYTIVGEEGWR
jgi:hypothetical protein